jgi:hypothetical protein
LQRRPRVVIEYEAMSVDHEQARAGGPLRRAIIKL